MHRTLKISASEYQQTVVTYRQTLYRAMPEAEKRLSARQQYLAPREKPERTLDAARQAETVYRNRCRAGCCLLKSWLDAQESRRQVEISLARNQLNRQDKHSAPCAKPWAMTWSRPGKKPRNDKSPSIRVQSSAKEKND